MPLPDVDHEYPNNGVVISWGETPNIDLVVQVRQGSSYSNPDISVGTVYVSGKTTITDTNAQELFLLSSGSGVVLDDPSHGVCHAVLPNFYGGLPIAQTNLFLKAWWVSGTGEVRVFWTEQWLIYP
jgi:hypothetical protein